MTDATEFTMTLEQMREVDDRIDALCSLADRLWTYDPDDDKSQWGHWSILKPIMTDVVGWERDRARVGLTYPVEFNVIDLRDVNVQDFLEDRASHRPAAETDVDRFLRSEQAWVRVLQYVTRQSWE